jgi:D-arabinose 1-dehydrogenase-like Zn-dependent alcohol dehydrogenase
MGQLALQYALALRLDVTVIGEAEDEEAVVKAGGKFIKLSEIGKSKVKFAATLLCVREIDSKLYSDAMGATKNGGKVIIVGHPVQNNIKFGFHMLVTSNLCSLP